MHFQPIIGMSLEIGDMLYYLVLFAVLMLLDLNICDIFSLYSMYSFTSFLICFNLNLFLSFFNFRFFRWF